MKLPLLSSISVGDTIRIKFAVASPSTGLTVLPHATDVGNSAGVDGDTAGITIKTPYASLDFVYLSANNWAIL
jgi:hypothetical protein